MAAIQEEMSPVVSISDLLRLGAIEWVAVMHNELYQCDSDFAWQKNQVVNRCKV